MGNAGSSVTSTVGTDDGTARSRRRLEVEVTAASHYGNIVSYVSSSHSPELPSRAGSSGRRKKGHAPILELLPLAGTGTYVTTEERTEPRSSLPYSVTIRNWEYSRRSAARTR